jgi:DNA-binding transcriptional MerR regulator
MVELADQRGAHRCLQSRSGFHAAQPTPSRTLEVKMGDPELTIGELATRTGVATSALRHWETLGLMSTPVRVSGQRRYPPSAVGRVGVILLLRDVGFSLREAAALLAAHADADGWRAVARRKLADLDRQIADAQTAREAIVHGLACPHDDVTDCPTFAGIVAGRLAGRPLAEAHSHPPAAPPADSRAASEPLTRRAGRAGGRG